MPSIQFVTQLYRKDRIIAYHHRVLVKCYTFPSIQNLSMNLYMSLPILAVEYLITPSLYVEPDNVKINIRASRLLCSFLAPFLVPLGIDHRSERILKA